MKRIFPFMMIVLLAVSIYSGENTMKKEGGVGGIIFFNTNKLSELNEFYINELGCSLWLDQGSCQIYKFGNMLYGFCQSHKADIPGIITFFFEKKKDVDRAYNKFKEIASSSPKKNPKYNIYHFFAKDPEGRIIEFQHFLGTVNFDFELFKQ